MIRLGAILFALTGVMGVTGMPPIAFYILREGRLPIIGGVPAAGGGPFEQLGPAPMGGLALGFAALSALEVVTARLLWQDRRTGAQLAIALFPPSLACWIGFALPIWLGIGPLRMVLLALGRQRLH